MFSTFGRQSSTVMRAIVSFGKQAAGGRKSTGKTRGFAGICTESGQELLDEGLETRPVGFEPRLPAQDRKQFAHGGFENIVHDDAIELPVMRHIRNRIPQPAFNDLLAVRLAIA